MSQLITPQGLVTGAFDAAEAGLSFEEYAEMITKVIISGQDADTVKQHLTDLGTHTIFDERSQKCHNEKGT